MRCWRPWPERDLQGCDFKTDKNGLGHYCTFRESQGLLIEVGSREKKCGIYIFIPLDFTINDSDFLWTFTTRENFKKYWKKSREAPGTGFYILFSLRKSVLGDFSTYQRNLLYWKCVNTVKCTVTCIRIRMRCMWQSYKTLMSHRH